MKVSYDTLNKNLKVKSIMHIKQTEPKEKISFRFTSLARITDIQLSANDKNYPVSYKFNSYSIFIDIPAQFQEYKQLSLHIEYQIPIDMFSHNKIFSVSDVNMWCPFNYEDITTIKLDIETPLNYEAFSTGDLLFSTSDKNHSYYTWKNENINGYLLIISPKNSYSISKKMIDSKELEFYFVNHDTSITNNVMNEFCKSFHCFNTIICGYKDDKLRLYEIPDSGFYAMTSRKSIMVGSLMLAKKNRISYERSIKSIFKTFDKLKNKSIFPEIVNNSFNNDSADTNYIYTQNLSWISHEIAHLWGYYYYKFNTRLYKFVTEGLAEYIRWMYIESEYGKDSLNTYISDLKYLFSKNCINTIYDIPVSMAGPSDAIQYFKGPLIFHYVRKQIGKENFISFIRTLYNKYFRKAIDYDIFRMELSKYDKSGKVIKRMEEMTEMTGELPPDL
ncbi:MAG: hypothetical protein A2X61_11125 [Ignavibacteria bacterium GWB2_35_12]|nr:MAG: hypothetical protein A2X63_09875 [Ignavibacteria bacterium GWA2_35_8]OGU39589.1 MAG: hypothetical protein A2X61_11125 [Ignavibacteria bacterium GWB2_35_12]OGV23990.1 MAG: hypothetical protein A2475_10770 [Ignavibacteria bacterium RIFOXYC2_FULL_35_21]